MNSIENIHGHIVLILPIEEIKAEVFCGDSIPEAGSGESIVRIHFILYVSLFIIYFFKVINDFNIPLD